MKTCQYEIEKGMLCGAEAKDVQGVALCPDHKSMFQSLLKRLGKELKTDDTDPITKSFLKLYGKERF